jgi:hypothetical protein
MSAANESLRKIFGSKKDEAVRFQVLTAASMMFRLVFWDISAHTIESVIK